MRVVTGEAGAVENRGAWRTRGAAVPLDYASIAAAMADPAGQKSRYFVLDPNILGLSRVLYHYDQRLNQFKGQYLFESIYPSTELVALRLLMVQKRSRGEKINLTAVLKRQALFMSPSRQPSSDDIVQTGVSREEIVFLQAVFSAAPFLFEYLHNPFIVKSLYGIGLIQADTTVFACMHQAHYRRSSCRCSTPAPDEEAIKIVALPSILAEFEFRKSGRPPALYPSENYRQAMARFEEDVLQRAAEAAAGSPSAGLQSPAQTFALSRKIAFCHLDRRPLVVHPGNVDEVVYQVCPQADLVLVILGKNVYLSLDFDSQRDFYPHTNKIYLDFLDLKYGQTQTETQAVADFIAAALTK